MGPDELYMMRALALAERGRGRTAPNPMVGALIVDAEGVVIGRGSHEFAGGPHAEILAFRDAGERARGATLYCTLEPCSHTGRTGPCAPAVVRAGIRRAVIAMTDPNPLVSGRGLAHLRAHGVEVMTGVLAHAAERLNGPFLISIRRQRPFLTMKVALSQEGFVAGEGGRRVPLTGASANRFVHRERAEVDAIAVGSGTILADDPLLTARGAYRVRPLTRVVLDRGWRTPPQARILGTQQAGPIIVIGLEPADREGRHRRDELSGAGATVEMLADIAAEPPEGFFQAAAGRLAARGLTSVVLEGGPRVHRAAWRAGLVDRVQMFQTPTPAGHAGVPWIESVDRMAGQLSDVTHTALGEDWLIEGYVHGTG